MFSVNISQAKRISIVTYLEAQGFKPVGFQTGEHLYLSPLRKEKKPSFKVREGVGNEGEDLWFDFGLGGEAGGDIIMLAQQLHNLSSTSEALKHLADYADSSVKYASPKTVSSQKSFFDQTNPSIEILGKPKPLNHFVILKYLREKRCIPDVISKQYLRLVYYQHKNKPSDKNYFGFAWQNQSGVYEIRGAGEKPFKSVTGKKNITVIPSKSSSGNVYIFEGMLDFLSALVMKRAMTLDGIVIVLNGSSMVKRMIPVLEGRDIDTIHVFTDNDAAGEQAHQKIKELYPNEKILKHTFYDSFKDVNEYVVNKFKA